MMVGNMPLMGRAIAKQAQRNKPARCGQNDCEDDEPASSKVFRTHAHEPSVS
jgi:hypothetical protein